MLRLLQRGHGRWVTPDTLIDVACTGPRLDTGSQFYKLRAGKHLPGLQTRPAVAKIDSCAQAACAEVLQSRRETRDWPGRRSVDASARYLSQQIAQAILRRASGEKPPHKRKMRVPALSVLQHS
ncbi:MAG: hypothetical protein AB8B58_06675 [Roseobacter sp.]